MCKDEDTLKTILTKLKTAVANNEVRICRIKFRLDEGYDVTEAGGYRDILVNMAFEPRDILVDNWHIVELQLNLKKFVQIKDGGGGHASYAVGRILQAFDPAAVTYTGMINRESVRDIKTGLIKKASLVGVDVDAKLEAKTKLGKKMAAVAELEVKMADLEAKIANRVRQKSKRTKFWNQLRGPTEKELQHLKEDELLQAEFEQLQANYEKDKAEYEKDKAECEKDKAEYEKDLAGMESTLTTALRSSSVQLVEFKLLNIKFSSDMGSLNWLAASVEHLAATLKVFMILECKGTGFIPPEIGMLHQLVKLDLSTNNFTGTLCSLFLLGLCFLCFLFP